VKDIPNVPWFLSLPACSAQVPCGDGAHTLRWTAGVLQLPSHADTEAELVLAALGGEKAGCVRVAEAWERHAQDLTVLEVGPRGPADQIMVSWENVPPDSEPGDSPHAGHGWVGMSGTVTASGPMRFPARPGYGPQRRLRQAIAAQLEQSRQRTTDLLRLLALGPAFSFRLAGHVAAANADRPTAANRPALRAALTARLAPIAEDWIGLHPDQVTGLLHAGDGWGSTELTGKGAATQLRIALPAGWLASVWACGLGLVARHLVVAVVRSGWPDAQVLAVRAPGAEPVLLDVHGEVGGPSDCVCWAI
jgi:hypothetical protein